MSRLMKLPKHMMIIEVSTHRQRAINQEAEMETQTNYQDLEEKA